MRLLSTMCTLLLFAASAAGAERAWKTGTWLPKASSGAYVLETQTDIVTAEAGTGETVAATPGTDVKFAIESTTLYVLDSRGEHTLRLIETSPKYSRNYQAVGSGHFVKSVAPGGTQVTLEDGSRWDIDPRQHFAVAGWQPDDLISIRREEGDPAFSFEIDNTTQDDGALANYCIR